MCISSFRRLQRGNCGTRVKVASAALTAWLLVGPLQASDVRHAVKVAMPATVAVERRDGSVNLRSKAGAILSRTDQVSFSSGTVVSGEGLIVTLTGADPRDGRYSVTFEDGQSMPAKLLVVDRRSGLELLKIQTPEALPFVELAEDDAEIGQEVVAVAATDVRDRVVTHGIIAATRRRATGSLPEMLQTDVSIGMMSAGGPLVDTQGRLLGIIAAKSAEDSRQSGLAFAIPVAYVRALLEARSKDETVEIRRGFLGVQLTASGEDGKPVVASVTAGTPAETAGFREGDELVAIGDDRVTTPGDVIRAVGLRKAGDTVTVTIRRDGNQQRVDVTLGELPAELEVSQARPPDRASGSGEIVVSDLTGLPALIWTPDGVRQLAPTDNRIMEELEKRLPPHAARAPGADDANWLRDDAVRKALEYWYQRRLQIPSVRVERSELDTKLDQLSQQVRDLQEQLEKLTKQLEKPQ